MSSEHSVSLHLPRYALWLLAFLLIGPWLALGAWMIASRAPAAPAPIVAPAATTANPASDVTKCAPGPWGDVEYFRILIEPPEEFVLTDYTQGGLQPWHFKDYTPATLAALWDSAGLTAAQRQFVANPAHYVVHQNEVTVTPDRQFIIDLSPTARARIYAALGQFSENATQHDPYRLRASASAAEDWLANTNLPNAAITLTKKLFYERGTALCFSDADIVLPTIPTAAQRVSYIKALARKSALVVQLHVAPNEDVDPLVAYWGRGGRSKDLKPLLQSLARRSEGGAIDIVHLVPRFARQLAYTYPLPSERPIDANHDCHWTSFNFQNDQPDERFSNIEYVRQVLLNDYYQVFGPPLLGDVIIFVRRDGGVIHSCVYIADDIVFTKNGPAFSAPWLFSTLADVQAFYASDPDIQMRRFRAKNL